MGIAILSGIMDSLRELNNKHKRSIPTSETRNNEGSPAVLPKRLPSRFVACVRKVESAERVADALNQHASMLEIRANDNIAGVQAADVVLLGCKPYMIADVLQAPGMREALAGKLLISILGGVTVPQIHDVLYKNAPRETKQCAIVRAMPNTAAAVRESMTMIEAPSPALAPETEALVTWIFTCIGKVIHLPASNMDACTALCGSGPAFVALVIESMAAGAIAMGIPRDEAYTMAAQTARGTTALLQAGEHPALLRDKVTTPGGCTIAGILVLEEAGVRGAIAKTIRVTATVASQLGQGK
jgi:pyrroline-5-carboxylate reductase